MADSPKKFLVTGVSSGLGRAVAEAALDDGHLVIGTVRDEAARAAFEDLKPGHAVGRLLDVAHAEEVSHVVETALREFGSIDVLVNNAGYGHEGTVEESPLQDLRRQFEVNVFGAVAVIKAVLPSMRRNRAGRIVNITSMGGLITMPGLAYYHGSKFALEGISESLGKEVRDLGIHVTAVEPGAFRTDWSGRSMIRSPRAIADYDAVFDPIRERRLEMVGKQPGDPKLAARAILELVRASNPPTHLLLGTDAVRLVRDKLDALTKEFAAWEQLSLSTDFG